MITVTVRYIGTHQLCVISDLSIIIIFDCLFCAFSFLDWFWACSNILMIISQALDCVYNKMVEVWANARQCRESWSLRRSVLISRVSSFNNQYVRSWMELLVMMLSVKQIYGLVSIDRWNAKRCLPLLYQINRFSINRHHFSLEEIMNLPVIRKLKSHYFLFLMICVQM